LAHRHGNWYVVGRDLDRDEPRSFKLARINGSVETLEGSYAIPKDFDAEAHVGGEAFEVGAGGTTGTIRFSSELRWWPEQNMADSASAEGPQGSLEVEVPIGNMSALVSWVIAFGGGVQIVSPGSARQALLDHLAPFAEAAS
jgi:proteasome accessory factor B